MEKLRLIVRYSILGTLFFYLIVCSYLAILIIDKYGFIESLGLPADKVGGVHAIVGFIALGVCSFLGLGGILVFAFPEIKNFPFSGEDC